MSIMSLFRRMLYPEISLILGIDIGSESVKISEVRYRKGMKPYFKNFAIEGLPLGLIDNGYIINEAGLVEHIKEIMARNYFTTKYAVVSINSRDIVLRQIELPSMSRQETTEALHWDLEKYVPSAASEEHSFDVHILSDNLENKLMKVLLVAVPKRIIDSLMLVMREAGIKLLAVDHEALAFGRTIRQEGNLVVIDIERMFTKITIFENSVPVLSRLIALGTDRVEELLGKLKDVPQDVPAENVSGGEVLSDLENNKLSQFVDDMSRDIIRTVTYFQSTNPFAQIESFYLTGEHVNNAELIGRFESRLRMKAEYISILDNLSINTVFKPEYLAQYETQLMVSVGLALWGEGDIV